MKGNKPGSKQIKSLRKQAEKVLSPKGITPEITDRKILEEELKRYRHQLEEIVEERTAEMKKEITQRMQAEEELKRFASFPLLNPNPVLEVDSSGRIIFHNNAAIETLKKLNLNNANVFLPDDISDILKALNQKSERQFYREIIIKDKIFGEVLYLAPQFNAIRIYATDITERKQAEEALQKALDESRQRHLEILALLEGSQAVLKYQNFKSAAQSIFNSCKNLIGATAGYVALLSKDGKENEVVFLDSGGLDCTVDRNLPMPIRGLRAEVYHNNKAAYHNDFSNSEWMKFMPKGHVRLDNVLFAPMIIEGKVIGLLGIANKPGGFNENNARMATAFAELASIALVQKRAEEALIHSEEYFRLLIENALDVITILEADGTIRYESPSIERVLGYKREDLIGRNAFEIVHPDDLQDVMKIFTHLAKNPGSTVFIQLRCQHKEGSWPILEVTGNNLLNNLTVAGIVLNSRDITERKKMEDEVRKSCDELEIRVQERTEELAKANEELQNKIAELNLAKDTLTEQSSLLEAFFKHTINPLVFLDKEFNFIRVNKAYAKVCQRDVSEFPGHNHFEFYPHEENEAIFRQVVKTKIPYQAIAKPFVFPDHPEWGVTYWNWTLTPLLDDKGAVEFLVFSLEDVTERKKAEDLLLDTKDRFQNTLESISDGFFTLDKQWHYTYLNSKAGKLIGTRSEELLGKNIWEVFPEVIGSPFYKMYHQAMTTGEVIHFEEYYPSLARWFEGSIYPFSDGISIYFQDVTDRKRSENRIKATNGLLKLFTIAHSRKDYLDSVVEFLHDWTGCCCIGIRILDKQGSIPYESYIGFSHEFWESENWISVKNHQCACIRVILEKPEPQDFPAMTHFGSFRSDNTIEFLKTLSEKEQTRFRGRCIQTGFKSVAIIPVRYKETVLGAIHLADKNENMVPLEKIEFIESITTLIGEATQRFNLEEELHENYFTQSAINMILSSSLENIPYEEFLKKALHMIISIPWLSFESSGCIHLVEDKPDVLVMKAQNNLPEPLKELCASIPFGKCICGRAALTQQIQFADHIDDRHDICNKGMQPHGHYAIPILFGGRTLGVINIYLNEGHVRNQKEEEFLQTIANTLAGIIIRRQSEDLLKKSEASLSEAQRIAHIGNWVLDIKTNELSWSDEIYHIFGLTPHQFGATYDAFLDSVHPDDRELVKNSVNDAFYEKEPYSIDHRIVLPNGKIRIVHEQGEVTFSENGEPIRMIGTVQDITERKMIEEELKESREQLRNLYTHLQSAREEERTHIAREIHDEFGTILTALKIDLSWLEKKLSEQQESLLERTKKDLELINSAIKTVQRISSELRPGILDHLGLAAAVEWHVKEFGNRMGMECDISIDIEQVKPDRDLSTAIFRILQEALTNIARYAEATKVTVSLNARDSLLVLEVIDNGKGITPEKLSDPHSFGLMGIKERVQYWGGDVEIKGIPDKGTTVTVSIPLEDKREIR